jgi:hypothetical protein
MLLPQAALVLACVEVVSLADAADDVLEQYVDEHHAAELGLSPVGAPPLLLDAGVGDVDLREAAEAADE